MKKIYALLLLIFACGFSAVAEEYVSVKASGVAVTAGGTVWTTSIARGVDGKGSVLLSRSDDLRCGNAIRFILMTVSKPSFGQSLPER